MSRKRNVIQYSLAILCIIVLVGIGIVTNISNSSEIVPVDESSMISVPSTVENTDFNIVMTVKNKEIELSEDEKQKITELCEKSLENNNSLLNLMMTKEEVESFSENGLSLEIEYKNGKDFTIMNCPITVNKVQILIDNNHSYLMLNSKEFFSAFSEELYEMLKGYLN